MNTSHALSLVVLLTLGAAACQPGAGTSEDSETTGEVLAGACSELQLYQSCKGACALSCAKGLTCGLTPSNKETQDRNRGSNLDLRTCIPSDVASDITNAGTEGKRCRTESDKLLTKCDTPLSCVNRVCVRRLSVRVQGVPLLWSSPTNDFSGLPISASLYRVVEGDTTFPDPNGVTPQVSYTEELVETQMGSNTAAFSVGIPAGRYVIRVTSSDLRGETDVFDWVNEAESDLQQNVNLS